MICKGSYFYVFVILALLFTLGGQAQPASARQAPAPRYRTITVTTTKDDIKKNGNCTLREAVQAANTNKTVDKCPAGSSSSTDVIKLGRATYVLSVTGRYEHYNQKGDIDITQSVKIVGAGRSYTIIDGKKIDRVFENRSTTATVTFQDLTIQNAYTVPRDGYILDEGGGIANKGKMYITRVRFYNNRVEGDGNDGVRGGGVFNTGTLTVSDSLFDKNSGGTGGAIGNSGKLTVDKTTFKQNFAYLAGAIFTSRAGALVNISNSLFQGNECGPGGTMVLYQYPGSTTNISNSTFQGHVGDIMISNRGTMTVRYSTFKDNSNATFFSTREGSLSFTHSTVRNNKSGGDGVRLESGRLVLDRMTFNDTYGPILTVLGGDARLHNSTISGVTETPITVRGGKLTIDMATIADNITGNNSALEVNGGAVTLHNSILANTRSETTGDPIVDCLTVPGTTTSLGYNLISRADGCGITAAKGDQFGTLAKPIDPMLGVLKNNGGSTYTRGLLPGSPAVDKADPLNSFKTDQRVYQRPVGKADIGAYERGAVK